MQQLVTAKEMALDFIAFVERDLLDGRKLCDAGVSAIGLKTEFWFNAIADKYAIKTCCGEKSEPAKRGGRPKGSKNKPKVADPFPVATQTATTPED